MAGPTLSDNTTVSIKWWIGSLVFVASVAVSGTLGYAHSQTQVAVFKEQMKSEIAMNAKKSDELADIAKQHTTDLNDIKTRTVLLERAVISLEKIASKTVYSSGKR